MDKEKLCPNCQSGLDALRLDPKEPVCIYMDFYCKNGCKMYRPIKPLKKGEKL